MLPFTRRFFGGRRETLVRPQPETSSRTSRPRIDLPLLQSEIENSSLGTERGEDTTRFWAWDGGFAPSLVSQDDPLSAPTLFSQRAHFEQNLPPAELLPRAENRIPPGAEIQHSMSTNQASGSTNQPVGESDPANPVSQPESASDPPRSRIARGTQIDHEDASTSLLRQVTGDFNENILGGQTLPYQVQAAVGWWGWHLNIGQHRFLITPFVQAGLKEHGGFTLSVGFRNDLRLAPNKYHPIVVEGDGRHKIFIGHVKKYMFEYEYGETGGIPYQRAEVQKLLNTLTSSFGPVKAKAGLGLYFENWRELFHKDTYQHKLYLPVSLEHSLFWPPEKAIQGQLSQKLSVDIRPFQSQDGYTMERVLERVSGMKGPSEAAQILSEVRDVKLMTRDLDRHISSNENVLKNFQADDISKLKKLVSFADAHKTALDKLNKTLLTQQKTIERAKDILETVNTKLTTFHEKCEIQCRDPRPESRNPDVPLDELVESVAGLVVTFLSLETLKFALWQMCAGFFFLNFSVASYRKHYPFTRLGLSLIRRIGYYFFPWALIAAFVLAILNILTNVVRGIFWAEQWDSFHLLENFLIRIEPLWVSLNTPFLNKSVNVAEKLFSWVFYFSLSFFIFHVMYPIFSFQKVVWVCCSLGVYFFIGWWVRESNREREIQQL